MQLISDKISRFVLDIFYPNRCPCCNGYIKWDNLVCEECITALENMEDEHFCEKCGRFPCICEEFEKKYYDRAYIYRPYLDKSRNGVLSMKRGNNKNYGEFSGDRLSEMLENVSADIVIPVPMTNRKKRLRGYNQAEIIAKRISANKGIPLGNDILIMKKSDGDQHYKKASERKNIINYLDISAENLSGMTVILCDDIITTGNTLNACGKLLKKNGADMVIAAAAAGTVFNTNL